MLKNILLSVFLFAVSINVSAVDSVKTPSPNLVKNPGFEDGLKCWPGWFMGPTLDSATFHSGKNSVKITDPLSRGKNGKGGVYQAKIVLDQKKPVPILISGWSKAESDGIGYDTKQYALRVIPHFDDDSSDWKLYLPFKLGKHDWEKVEKLYIPEKPVKFLNVYCLFKKHKGSVWFDDISIREIPAVSSGEEIKEQCRVTEEDLDGNGNKAVVMENEFFKMIFRPGNGATCDSFLYKKTGTQFAGKNMEFRLFTDRLRSIGRMLLPNKRYNYKIELNSPEKVRVRFWVTGIGDYSYLELHRIVTIWKDRSEVKVDYEFYNRPESMAPVVISPYFRHGLNIYGKEDSYRIPTAKGIVSYKDTEGSGNKYYKDIVRGWFADSDSAGTGMACEYDFKYLEEGYNWLGGDKCSTLEWWFVPLKIKDGETFKTSCTFIPYRNLPEIDGVENGLLCSIKPSRDGKLNVNLVSCKARTCKINLEAVLKKDGSVYKTQSKWISLNPDQLERLVFQLPSNADYVKCIVNQKDKISSEFEVAFKPGFVFKARERKVAPVDVPPKDLLLSSAVETPHINWGKPYYKGKINALILVGSECAREIIELSQRMDIVPQTVQLSESNFCNQYVVDKYYGNYTYKDANRSLAKRLESDYDIIIVSGNLWKHINPSNTKKLLKKVKDGTALILITPNAVPEELAEMIGLLKSKVPFYKQWINPRPWLKEVKHFITDGIPFELLPPAPFYRIDTQGDTLISGGGKPVAKIIDGKGRIAIFNYASTRLRSTIGTSLTPHFPINYQGKTYNFWEYYFSLLAKTILWCSRKEPDIKFAEFQPKFRKSDYAKLKDNWVKISLESENDIEDVSIRLNFRDNDSKIVSSKSKSVTLKKGKNPFTFTLPETLRPGMNSVDAIIKKGESICNWGSTGFELETNAKIKGFKPEKDTYKAGETIKGTVEISAERTDNLVSEILLKDSYGRIVGSKIFKSPKTKIKFDFTPKCPLTVINTLECVLLNSKRVFDRKSYEITVTPARRKLDDYTIQCWVITDIPKYYLMPVFTEIIKNRTGIDCMYHFRVNPGLFKEYAKADLKMVMTNLAPQHIKKSYYESRKMYAKTKDKKFLARKPCLNDPEYLEKQKNKIISWTKPSLKYAPAGYEYGDENSLTLWHNKFDYCFSKHTLDAFRRWLKDEYGNLDNLNSEWNTGFTSWESVVPATTKEITEKAKTDRNYSQWADHRTFMEKTFADFYRYCKKIVYSFNPGIPLGISGTQPASSYTGYDWSRLMPNFDMMHSYKGKQQKEYIRSFKKDVNCTSWTCGYGKKGVSLEYNIWLDALLFRGKGTSFFATVCILAPDFSIPTATADMVTYTKDLREGAGKLLRGCNDAQPEVMIHYSQPSIHAATIEDKMPLFDANREGWVKLFEDLSIRYKFISYQQIENGDLSKCVAKVLVLPMSIAMSQEEINEIKKFVENGGTVIADAQIAVMDEHCRLLKSGRLDDVFGIERESVTSTAAVKKIFFNKTGFSCRVDNGSLKCKTAKPLAYTAADKGGEPIAIYENKTGKGDAIYLNFTLNGYSSLRKNTKKDLGCLAVIKEVFSKYIKPQVKVDPDGGSISGCRVFLYDQKSGKSKANFVGVISDYTVNKTAKDIQITFPHKSYVYDVRKKQLMGYCDNIKTQIHSGEAKLYAMMPYKCEGVRIQGLKDTYKPGQNVKFNISLENKGEAIPADHVYVVQVYRPNGTLYRYYGKNIQSINGVAMVEFKLALDDPRGTWKINAYDVISGKTDNKSFELSP